MKENREGKSLNRKSLSDVFNHIDVREAILMIVTYSAAQLFPIYFTRIKNIFEQYEPRTFVELIALLCCCDLILRLSCLKI